MKHAASVHPEPGSNSPLSEKFMSLVHTRFLKLNRSTSFIFVRFIFFKINRYLYRLQLFYCQCSISSQFYPVTRFEILSLPHSLQIPQSLNLSFATSSILSPQFRLSTSFLKNLFDFFLRSLGLLKSPLKEPLGDFHSSLYIYILLSMYSLLCYVVSTTFINVI